MSKLGGISESSGVENSLEIESLAQFAVSEHNKKEIHVPNHFETKGLLLLYSSKGNSIVGHGDEIERKKIMPFVVTIDGKYFFGMNADENAVLEFGKILKSKQQVAAGTVHYITLEANDGGEKKVYEAKVWVKPWLKFQELQEFKLAH